MADTPPVPRMNSEFAYEWTGSEVDHFNAPELNSPQPCEHGAGCTYYGSCRFVHPGEEGTGRMIFEERVVTNEDGSTYTQLACVRLIGAAGFYRRRRAQMSWPEFCARNGIPYTPNPPRQREEGGDEENEDATPAPRQARGPRQDVSGGAGSGRAGGWQPRGDARGRGGGRGGQSARGGSRGGQSARGGGRGRPAPRQWVGLAQQQP